MLRVIHGTQIFKSANQSIAFTIQLITHLQKFSSHLTSTMMNRHRVK